MCPLVRRTGAAGSRVHGSDGERPETGRRHAAYVEPPIGRQSATAQMREEQTLYDPSRKLVMQAKGASSQHALTIGEDTFQVHLTSRARWTNEYGGGSYHVVLQIVDGVVIVDHQR
jgi:hypothetical protein